MITQEALDGCRQVLLDAYQAIPAFATLEVFTYWPDPIFNPVNDYIILHEGTEADALISLGGSLRSTPTGNGMPYIPDWLLALYRQRPVSQQPGETSQSCQDRMRQAKLVLSNVFKRVPDIPIGAPQPLNLYGAVAEAGKLVTVRHPLTGPYETDAGVKVVRFTFLGAISLRSNVH